MKKCWPMVVCAIALLSVAMPAANAEGVPGMEEGRQMKVHYTLTVEGQVVDTSEGRDPLLIELGSEAVIPAFEAELEDMKQGERKSFTIEPEEGYGARDPKAVVGIPRANLPEGDIQVGMVFSTMVDDQHPLQGIVMAIEGDNVILDFNHPLAGKTLEFDVEIVEIM